MIHGQKRHIKRRLTNPTYLKLYQDILAKNGCLEIKTDNQKLFEYTVKEVNNFPFKIEEISLDLHKSEYNETNITTEYEERFKQLNKPIYYLKARFWEDIMDTLEKEWKIYEELTSLSGIAGYEKRYIIILKNV